MMNDILQGISAIGVFVMAYLTYKKLREDRLMKNVEIHNDTLKDFLCQWRDRLPIIVPAETFSNCYEDYGFEVPELSIRNYDDTKFNIEGNVSLFEDMKRHLYGKYDTLFNDLDQYKRKIIDYDNSRYDLYKDIRDHIQIQRRDTFPPESIFTKAISSTKKDNALTTIYDYNYDKDDKRLEYRTGKNIYILKTVHDDKEIDEIKGDFEKISRDYNIFKFKEKIDRIMIYETELKNLRTKLCIAIDGLILTPILPNMSCEYIKNSFK